MTDVQQHNATNNNNNNTSNTTTIDHAIIDVPNNNNIISATIQPSTTLRPLVICGPSGVGKGTLLAKLLHDYPYIFKRSISHTTRAPRQGEIHGSNYYFTDKETMNKQIKNNEFIESALIHGNLYGQSIAAVQYVCNNGYVCILEIDVQGALSIKQTTLNPYYIFILPPSTDVLKERLVRRGSENDSTLNTRLQTAENELLFLDNNRNMFDAILTNNALDVCYNELIDILKKWYSDLFNKKQQNGNTQ